MMHAGIVGFLPEDGSDVWERFKACAKIGYRAMDMDLTYAAPQGDLKENYKRVMDIGIKPIMSGVGKDVLENFSEKIRTIKIQNIDRVCMYSSSILDSYNFGDVKPTAYDDMMRDFEFMNQAIAMFAEEGIKFCYHNHFQEFVMRHEGISAFDRMLMEVDPRLCFNLDVGWVMMSGQDPVDVLKRLEGRIGGIHMKDFYSLDRPSKWESYSFTSLGSGKLNVDAVLQEMDRQGVEYACVEQDRLRNLNALDTLKVSYLRMKESGYVI